MPDAARLASNAARLSLLLACVLLAGCPTNGISGNGGSGDMTVCRGAGCACSTNTDCGGALKCDPTTRRCVSCTIDNDCLPGQLCNHASGTCTSGCSASRGCPPDAGSCELDAGVCVGCLSDADCTDAAAPRCDTTAGRCAPCLPDSDNCGHALYCAPANGSYACAAGCKDDGDCMDTDAGVPDGGHAATCDTVTHKCVDCSMDNDCPPGKVCVGGTCTDGCSQAHTCPRGLACCNGTCHDPQSDFQNCGGCGMACTGGWSCCGGNCKDPVNDVSNCGGCGTACSVLNGTPGCANRMCNVKSCSGSFADCNGVYADGCETDLSSTVTNCGTCNKACSIMHAQPRCAGGVCVIDTCLSPFGDCDNNMANGCETDVMSSDNNNCGGCGKVCAIANGTGACQAGLCKILTCNANFADCNNDPSDGCETNLLMDPQHCGGCNAACSINNGTPFCIAGSCQIACNGGWNNCDNNVSNGCETHTDVDPNNCGLCNTQCVISNGTAGCAAGRCVVAGCNAPFADCDAIVNNGCETNTLTDVRNCGGCGGSCPGQGLATDQAFCSNGACGMTCIGENYDVNNSAGDGCEVVDQDPPGHSQGTASSRGSKPCDDGASTDSFSANMPSDSRVHQSPSITGFNGTVGSAPDFWTVFGTGGTFCADDYSVTFTTAGGGNTSCYRCTIQTNKGSNNVTVNGHGSATMTGGLGSYSDNTAIYFIIDKICNLPVQENVSYTVSYHL